MHSQKLISILVWMAVLCLSSVVSELEPSELARNLNILLRHPGWRDGMHDVKLLINDGRDVSDPMSEILEAISANRDPIDEFNVYKKYKEIWRVLMCKYAEIIHDYKILIQNYIRFCRYEKHSVNPSLQRYNDCFRLLLVKLHSASPRFKCMQDALEFVFALGPQTQPNYSLLVATEKLTKYTLTIGPETSAKLTGDGFEVDAVDREIKCINDFFLELHNSTTRMYSRRSCVNLKPKQPTVDKLKEDAVEKKNKELIPQEMAMMEYITNELDSYISEIFDGAFYNLGFAYEAEGKVTIRTN